MLPGYEGSVEIPKRRFTDRVWAVLGPLLETWALLIGFTLAIVVAGAVLGFVHDLIGF